MNEAITDFGEPREFTTWDGAPVSRASEGWRYRLAACVARELRETEVVVDGQNFLTACETSGLH